MEWPSSATVATRVAEKCHAVRLDAEGRADFPGVPLGQGQARARARAAAFGSAIRGSPASPRVIGTSRSSAGPYGGRRRAVEHEALGDPDRGDAWSRRGGVGPGREGRAEALDGRPGSFRGLDDDTPASAPVSVCPPRRRPRRACARPGVAPPGLVEGGDRAEQSLDAVVECMVRRRRDDVDADFRRCCPVSVGTRSVVWASWSERCRLRARSSSRLLRSCLDGRHRCAAAVDRTRSPHSGSVPSL